MKRIKFSLDGMGCGGCVKNVRSALALLPGLVIHDVAVGFADVSYDPERTSEDAVTAGLSAAGYPTRLSDGAAGMVATADKGGRCGITR